MADEQEHYSKNQHVPGLDEADAAMAIGLNRNAGASNYLQWIADLVSPFLGSDVIEVGAGHGDVTALIADGSRRVLASEISPLSLPILEKRFAGRSDVTITDYDLTSRALARQYDSAYLVNVLEHIKDDMAAVRNIARSVRPGGSLVIYVPAFMLLYSPWDRAIGHYRRYRLKDLARILQGCDLEMAEGRYVNSIGGLGWLTYCRILRRPAADEVSVSTFDRVIVPAVRRVEERIAPPFGISALVVGRKRTNGN